MIPTRASLGAAGEQLRQEGCDAGLGWAEQDRLACGPGLEELSNLDMELGRPCVVIRRTAWMKDRETRKPKTHIRHREASSVMKHSME